MKGNQKGAKNWPSKGNGLLNKRNKKAQELLYVTHNNQGSSNPLDITLFQDENLPLFQ